MGHNHHTHKSLAIVLSWRLLSSRLPFWQYLQSSSALHSLPVLLLPQEAPPLSLTSTSWPRPPPYTMASPSTSPSTAASCTAPPLTCPPSYPRLRLPQTPTTMRSPV